MSRSNKKDVNKSRLFCGTSRETPAWKLYVGHLPFRWIRCNRGATRVDFMETINQRDAFTPIYAIL